MIEVICLQCGRYQSAHTALDNAGCLVITLRQRLVTMIGRAERAEAELAHLTMWREQLGAAVRRADAAEANRDQTHVVMAEMADKCLAHCRELLATEDALAKAHEVRRQLGAVLDQFVDEHDSPEVGHGPCRCDICEAGHIALAASAALDTAGAKEKQ